MHERLFLYYERERERERGRGRGRGWKWREEEEGRKKVERSNAIEVRERDCSSELEHVYSTLTGTRASSVAVSTGGGGGGGGGGRSRSSDSFLPDGQDAGFFCDLDPEPRDRVPWESRHQEAAVKSRRHDTRRAAVHPSIRETSIGATGMPIEIGRLLSVASLTDLTAAVTVDKSNEGSPNLIWCVNARFNSRLLWADLRDLSAHNPRFRPIDRFCLFHG